MEMGMKTKDTALIVNHSITMYRRHIMSETEWDGEGESHEKDYRNFVLEMPQK